MPKIERGILSVGQLTDDPHVNLNFKGENYIIKRKNEVIERGTKGFDNLYLIYNTENDQKCNIVNSKENSEDNADISDAD